MDITYTVTYHVGDGIYSTNLLQGNRDAVFAEAERHAERYGYRLVSVKPITLAEVAEYRAKEMPFEKVS